MIIFYETHFNGKKECHRITTDTEAAGNLMKKTIAHLGFKIVKTISQGENAKCKFKHFSR
jgi:hypothetical protein